MGWVKKFDPEHYCQTPRITKSVGAGSVWKCDECGQEWVVSNSYHPLSPVFTRATHTTRITESS